MSSIDVDAGSRTPRPSPSRIVAAAWLAAAIGTACDAAAQATAASEPTLYQLDAGHTTVHWEVLHMGRSTIRGRFTQVAGTVRFDAARHRLEVGITAETASVSTGIALLDKQLRGSDLLAVDEFAQAYFTARQASWNGDAPREISGEITLRGVSRPLRLQALRFSCGFNPLFGREVCGGDFEGLLQRSDFDMTLALPLVANDVRLLVQVEGVRSE